jgi:hypothetical protein
MSTAGAAANCDAAAQAPEALLLPQCTWRMAAAAGAAELARLAMSTQMSLLVGVR